MTAAFLHADLDEKKKVYVRMPLGFRKEGKVLKLKRLRMALTGFRTMSHICNHLNNKLPCEFAISRDITN